MKVKDLCSLSQGKAEKMIQVPSMYAKVHKKKDKRSPLALLHLSAHYFDTEFLTKQKSE